MTLEVPTRKIDNKTTIYSTNTPIFDAPIVQERNFDRDDFEGVIEDLDNPYDQTIPVTVVIPELIEPLKKSIKLLH